VLCGSSVDLLAESTNEDVNRAVVVHLPPAPQLLEQLWASMFFYFCVLLLGQAAAQSAAEQDRRLDGRRVVDPCRDLREVRHACP
jgi:hypothetical protein